MARGRPSPNEQAQIDFIIGYLRKGMQRKEILQLFTKSYKTSTKTFDTRLKLATEAFQAEQQRIRSKAEESVSSEIESLKIKIMTVAERQALLTEMALGNLESEQLISTPEGIKKVKVRPTHSERRAAIAELNKMGGDYAPAKQIISVNKIGLDALEDAYE